MPKSFMGVGAHDLYEDLRLRDPWGIDAHGEYLTGLTSSEVTDIIMHLPWL
ncbi:hypothetical protein GCM10007981_04600 [Thermocladium modestius]|uniref:Uncharacterized protein n=1 Tax=Thermocladium modestius TaxID=62609 RepID=A0A830GSP9_9CREN|nr:hypothetical protein GCM10007981_04600 [Thermocladium modestius]